MFIRCVNALVVFWACVDFIISERAYLSIYFQIDLRTYIYIYTFICSYVCLIYCVPFDVPSFCVPKAATTPMRAMKAKTETVETPEPSETPETRNKGRTKLSEAGKDVDSLVEIVRLGSVDVS